jgi:hypothetical protein
MSDEQYGLFAIHDVPNSENCCIFPIEERPSVHPLRSCLVRRFMFRSRAIPLLDCDSQLPEDTADEPGINRASVRIGDCDPQTAAPHPLVFSAGKRSFEAKCFELHNQFTP